MIRNLQFAALLAALEGVAFHSGGWFVVAFLLLGTQVLWELFGG